jgi:hypothetical protein
LQPLRSAKDFHLRGFGENLLFVAQKQKIIKNHRIKTWKCVEYAQSQLARIQITQMQQLPDDTLPIVSSAADEVQTVTELRNVQQPMMSTSTMMNARVRF